MKKYVYKIYFTNKLKQQCTFVCESYSKQAAIQVFYTYHHDIDECRIYDITKIG